MSLINLFDSRDKKKRLSHIKNLVALACSDGELSKSEKDIIFRIGNRAGLTTNELQRIVEQPDSVNFYPPETAQERIEQLYDMVLVMMVDGEFHENEVALCKLVAIRLGFKHQIIDKMVYDTIDMIAKGVAVHIAVERLLREVG